MGRLALDALAPQTSIFWCNLPQVTVILRYWAGTGMGQASGGLGANPGKPPARVLKRPPGRADYVREPPDGISRQGLDRVGPNYS